MLEIVRFEGLMAMTMYEELLLLLLLLLLFFFYLLNPQHARLQ